MASRTKKTKKKEPWAVNAAKFCWMSVIAALLIPILINVMATSTPRAEDAQNYRLLASVLWIVLTVGGIGAGVSALAVAKGHKRSRVMVPAIVGIVLHLVVGTLLIVALMGALAAAKKIQEQREQEQQQQQDQQPSSMVDPDVDVYVVLSRP